MLRVWAARSTLLGRESIQRWVFDRIWYIGRNQQVGYRLCVKDRARETASSCALNNETMQRVKVGPHWLYKHQASYLYPQYQHYDLIPSPIRWWRQDSWFLSSNLVMGSGVQPLATENAVQGPATSPITGLAIQNLRPHLKPAESESAFSGGSPVLLISQEIVSRVIPAKTLAQPIVPIWLDKRDLSAECLLNDEVTGRHPAEKTCVVCVTESHGNIRTLSSSFGPLPKLFVLPVGG